MHHASRSEQEESDDGRDFDAEFETFLLEHAMEIKVEQVYHLNPQIETADELRQHNYAVVRSTRSKRSFTLCMTSMNWDNFAVLAPHVLNSLATEANMLGEAGGEFLTWAAGQGFDPDSRGAERKFRQTVAMVADLKAVLGDRAYDELLDLQNDAAAARQAQEDELDDDEPDDEELDDE